MAIQSGPSTPDDHMTSATILPIGKPRKQRICEDCGCSLWVCKTVPCFARALRAEQAEAERTSQEAKQRARRQAAALRKQRAATQRKIATERAKARREQPRVRPYSQRAEKYRAHWQRKAQQFGISGVAS
jgi:hypothetical protein